MSATEHMLANAPPDHLLRALLPWEDDEDFRNLHAAYVETYAPAGPAETGLIEEIVWIDWRRRRLKLGERALHMSQLHSRTSGEEFDGLSRRAVTHIECGKPTVSSREAVRSDEDDDQALKADSAEDFSQTEAALVVLEEAGKDAFEQARVLLREDTREWFDESTEDDQETRNAGALETFLRTKVLSWHSRYEAGLDARPSIRLQAHGESLDPIRMDKLLALDERLTRQFEKALGMLIRLQELREKMAL